jgi:hypothetical protein
MLLIINDLLELVFAVKRFSSPLSNFSSSEGLSGNTSNESLGDIVWFQSVG